MSKTLDKIIKILIYRFLGKLFLEAKWSSKYMPNVLGERKHMYLPDNTHCTIRERTFLSNFFQPLVSETKWPDYVSYMYSYILDSLAKK